MTGSNETLTFLDCTFRDGGYYNHWDFDRDLVGFYLAAMGNAKVDAIEMGFRILSKGNFQGAFAYTTDEFLAKLPLPQGILIGVMVNAKELLNHAAGSERAVDLLFQEASRSPVGLVRVAAHFSETPRCGPILTRLKELGYKTGLNLMQAGGRSDSEITEVAKMVSSWGTVDVLYFADSLGNMNPGTVAQTARALRSHWQGPLGFHAHDNKGQALGNCLAAIDAGISWLDGTLLGMGRGAGNVRTEHLLLELQQKGFPYHAQPLFPLILEHFEELRQRYGWGMNLLYYLSACYGIHPTYVQDLLANQHFEPHQMVAALESLKQEGSYSSTRLQQAVLRPQTSTSDEGTWSAASWNCPKGRDFLLIAPGPGMIRHLEAILRFIERTDPVVICLNANPVFPWERVTAYAACHQARLFLDSDLLTSLKKPLMAPFSAIPETLREKFKKVELLNYGMKVVEGTFEVRPTGCTLPVGLVAGYAFAVSVASGARRILMAGFDGFGPNDPRHVDMDCVLHHYQEVGKGIPLVAVTPTMYPIEQASIYAPDL